MSATPCLACDGFRLKPEALAVKVARKHIGEVSELSVRAALDWFRALPDALDKKRNEIAFRILKEIRDRLNFLVDVGLDYLTLSRNSGSLSGGESQRIRLASQIGSGLTGVLYVLDEPSIGLHQRDNDRLLDTLRRLRDLGNSVIVVEHDEDAILARRLCRRCRPGRRHSRRQNRRAGDAAGDHGVSRFAHRAISDRRRQVILRHKLRKPTPGVGLKLFGARGNNLRTSRKCRLAFSLASRASRAAASRRSSSKRSTRPSRGALSGAHEHPAPFDRLEGLEQIDKIIDIDQSPIGRTPRSNPATYTGAFTPIRECVRRHCRRRRRAATSRDASPSTSRAGAAKPARATACIKIEMHFLPDVYVTCDVCKGKRYNRETLEVQYREKSIADVLDMTVEEAAALFKAVPSDPRQAGNA